MLAEKIKTFDDLKLKGITFDGAIDKHGKISNLKLIDEDQNEIFINKSQYDNTLEILVKAKQKVYRVEGTLLGLEISEPFFEKHEAENFIEEKSLKVGVHDIDLKIIENME